MTAEATAPSTTWTAPRLAMGFFVNLRVEERNLGAAVLDAAHGNVYFGTDNTYPAHVYMIHVGDGSKPMREVGRLDLQGGSLPNPPRDGDNTKPQGEVGLYGEVHIRSAISGCAAQCHLFWDRFAAGTGHQGRD